VTAAAPERAEQREEALARLGAAFKGMLAALRRLRGRETHRPGELSFAQYHLLFGLSDGALSTSRLATAADLSPATTTQMLDGLVAMGLVERTRSDSDRRVVTCTLTERGRELIAEKRARWEQRWREAMAEFSSDELATAAAVIERMRVMYEVLDLDPQRTDRLAPTPPRETP
jgi:DNA-binding MarR family transcriptional regulator